MRVSVLLAGVAMLGMVAGPAAADTLREALVKAYNTNPGLAAARADVRATDENVPIAKCGGAAHRQRSTAAIPRTRSTARTRWRRPIAGCRRNTPADRPALPRRAGREFGQGRRSSLRRGARSAARDRIGPLRRRRRRLYGRDPRRGDRRAQQGKREGAGGQPPGRQGPVPGRRPDPHRRRAVRSAARDRAQPAARPRRRG